MTKSWSRQFLEVLLDEFFTSIGNLLWNLEILIFFLQKILGGGYSFSISSPKVIHPTKILLRKILQSCRRHDRFFRWNTPPKFHASQRISGHIWSILTNPTNFISACWVPSWGLESWTWFRWDLLSPKLHRNPSWVGESRTWILEVDLHLEFSLSGCCL